ncbi:DUF1361 domain-containing protein [Corallococcus sp. M34]|uniref:DUF1361 domain-containing protein n=1 Tax=Citreicoccus inhibens TaxID=2849499 RepID=UPI001C217134|nr:DUF1361 domain-containing protein [Citreicoccus inhibens]MBU8896827.1 DUF1361 domain-containing protein [Citreicoccus inhibens]
MSQPPSAFPALLSMLRRHGLVPALLCSTAAVALLAFRLDWSQGASYVFLLWNLILAWLPYLLALAARWLMVRGQERWWSLGPLAVAWLALFPNAPYLLTDFIHLSQRPVVPMWFDAALLALFAATGWLLGLLSLEIWKHWLQRRWGPVGAWAFVALTSLLCGYGIYLGRVERWNSWDVLADPRRLLSAVHAHATAPGDFPYLLGVTVLFAALLLLSYAAFESLRLRFRRAQWQRS